MGGTWATRALLLLFVFYIKGRRVKEGGGGGGGEREPARSAVWCDAMRCDSVAARKERTHSTLSYSSHWSPIFFFGMEWVGLNGTELSDGRYRERGVYVGLGRACDRYVCLWRHCFALQVLDRAPATGDCGREIF